jgi:hypothetical protein
MGFFLRIEHWVKRQPDGAQSRADGTEGGWSRRKRPEGRRKFWATRLAIQVTEKSRDLGLFILAIDGNVHCGMIHHRASPNV